MTMNGTPHNSAKTEPRPVTTLDSQKTANAHHMMLNGIKNASAGANHTR